jgi:hypothetical protein
MYTCTVPEDFLGRLMAVIFITSSKSLLERLYPWDPAKKFESLFKPGKPCRR